MRKQTWFAIPRAIVLMALLVSLGSCANRRYAAYSNYRRYNRQACHYHYRRHNPNPVGAQVLDVAMRVTAEIAFRGTIELFARAIGGHK